jgi:hypothetical protein
LEEDTFNHSINNFASRYFIDVTERPFSVIDDIYLKFSDKNELLFPKKSR